MRRFAVKAVAWLCDVVVDEQWRRRGIGTWLVGAVVDDLHKLDVFRVVLTTRDAHGVYAGLGFEPLRVPQTWMEIDLRATRPEPGDVLPFRSNGGPERTDPAVADRPG